MYISLYRRYRPQTFSDMVGQSAAVGVLMESLREGSLGHAYLFSGPRGCGKTSAARLLTEKASPHISPEGSVNTAVLSSNISFTAEDT